VAPIADHVTATLRSVSNRLRFLAMSATSRRTCERWRTQRLQKDDFRRKCSAGANLTYQEVLLDQRHSSLLPTAHDSLLENSRDNPQLRSFFGSVPLFKAEPLVRFEWNICTELLRGLPPGSVCASGALSHFSFIECRVLTIPRASNLEFSSQHR
jgi:hypothetical protein